MDGGTNNHNREQTSNSIPVAHKKRPIVGAVDVEHLRKLETRRLKRHAKSPKNHAHQQALPVPKKTPEPPIGLAPASGYLFIWRDPSMRVYTCCRCKQFFPDLESLVGHKYCAEHVVFVHQPDGGIVETSTPLATTVIATRIVQHTVPGHDQAPVDAPAAAVHHPVPVKRLKFTMVQFAPASATSATST